MADLSDGDIGLATAGHQNRSATLTTSFAKIISARANRVGFMFENSPANATNITVRVGSAGEEVVITPGGSWGRDAKKGESNICMFDLYAKGAAGSEALIAAEW